MAIREIRVMGDPILEKTSKVVKHNTSRNQTLIADMLDTMYDANGVGLAAVQVGVLKRIVTMDVGEGPIILINPEILMSSGEQIGEEGCLSLPGKYGIVKRPDFVRVKALDEDFNPFIIEGEDLAARALCHEIAHLNGEMYVGLVEDGLHDTTPIEEESYEEQELIDEAEESEAEESDEERGPLVRIYREGEAFQD